MKNKEERLLHVLRMNVDQFVNHLRRKKMDNSKKTVTQKRCDSRYMVNELFQYY